MYKTPTAFKIIFNIESTKLIGGVSVLRKLHAPLELVTLPIYSSFILEWRDRLKKGAVHHAINDKNWLINSDCVLVVYMLRRQDEQRRNVQ